MYDYSVHLCFNFFLVTCSPKGEHLNCHQFLTTTKHVAINIFLHYPWQNDHIGPNWDAFEIERDYFNCTGTVCVYQDSLANQDMWSTLFRKIFLRWANNHWLYTRVDLPILIVSSWHLVGTCTGLIIEYFQYCHCYKLLNEGDVWVIGSRQP